MNKLQPLRLTELKTQAHFLLKDLERQSDVSLKAANRFRIHPAFAEKTDYWLLENTDAIQLKHAYTVLALEKGFTNWAALRNTVIESDCLYRASAVAFIHAWFKNYLTARAYLMKNGGYLLSFWDDFVVCGKEYVTRLGLIDYESQWKNIGFDWHEPKDAAAFQFLKEAAIKIYLFQQ